MMDGEEAVPCFMFYYREVLNVLEPEIKFDFESFWLNVLYRNIATSSRCVYRPLNNNKFLTNT